MKIDYIRVPVLVPVGLAICGLIAFFPSVILDVAFGAGAGLGLLAAGLTLVFTSKDSPPIEPPLYRYEVDMGPKKSATVYAASVYLDDHHSNIYVFEDHDGNPIAIYSHVSSIAGRKVLSEED